MNNITQYILTYNLGDWASILGVLIALIGFIFTIYKVLKLKNEIVKARNDFLLAKTMFDFSSAIVLLDEIKRLQREGEWKIVLDRYSGLKKSLLFIRESNPRLSDNHKAIIQDAILSFSKIQEKVEDSLYQKAEPDNVSRLNTIVSRQIDSLQIVFFQIQNTMGR